MKTKPIRTGSFRKNSAVILLSTLTLAGAFINRTAVAQDHQLVITENSSSSLSVFYDGLSGGITVVPGASDTWLVTFPSTTHLGFELDWQEPGDPTLVNDFNIYLPDIGISNTWVVSSEFTLPGGPSQDSAQPPDGHTFAMVGSDFLDDTPIDITFHDLDADTAAVPEPAGWMIAALTTIAVLGTVRRRDRA